MSKLLTALLPPALGSDNVCPESFYAGKIALLPPSALSLNVVRVLQQALQQALFPAPDIATAHRVLDGNYLRERLHRLRIRLYSDQVVLQNLAQIIQELANEWGWPELPYVDLPRLRAIVPNMHQLPAAADAFSAHRDTWYANPPAQINLWIPLGDYPAQQTFVFYPDYFCKPVANDSADFDYEQWRADVGWQSLRRPDRSVYPQALETLKSTQLGFACEAGQRLLFSGSHLHQPLPNQSQHIRYSLDLRLVCPADHQLMRGAPQVDNGSRGSTWSEFVPLATWQ
ncbi:MAG: hypothetical protein AB7I41_18040 [Candidatus Sericytochromatia bacterium]